MTPETKVERPPYIDPKLREWRKLVGVPGDLADRLLAILSHASLAGLSKISRRDLHESFARFEREFPSLIPELVMRQQPDFYSYSLGRAMDSALRLGVDPVLSTDFDFEVTPENAERNLEDLRERAGDDFVDSLQPVGACLADLIKEKQTS